MLGENLMEGAWFWKAPIATCSRYSISTYLPTPTQNPFHKPFTTQLCVNKAPTHLILFTLMTYATKLDIPCIPWITLEGGCIHNVIRNCWDTQILLENVQLFARHIATKFMVWALTSWFQLPTLSSRRSYHKLLCTYLQIFKVVFVHQVFLLFISIPTPDYTTLNT